jgi:MSHA biogenesis protein MshJ
MQLWERLNDGFSALSNREKWLIALGGVVGLFFILLTLLLDPVMNSHAVLKRQIQNEQSQRQQMVAQIQQMNALLAKNPDQQTDEQLQALTLESQQLAEQMAEVVERLTTPREMAQLLERVLENGRALKLVSLQSLPAEPILVGQEETPSSYYIHPVRIELTGKYFDIKEYLETLEELPVRYYWRSFSYQVEAYPQARLIMEVYTLGTRQEFIGG